MMKLLNRELEALGTPEALAELERRAESRNMRKGVVSYPKLPPKAAKKNPAYAHWTSDPQYSYEQFFRANPAPEMTFLDAVVIPPKQDRYGNSIWTQVGEETWVVHFKPQVKDRIGYPGMEIVRDEEGYYIPNFIGALPRLSIIANTRLEDAQGEAKDLFNWMLSSKHMFRANPAPEMPKSSRLPVPMNAGPYLPELFQTRISDGFPAEYKNNPGLSSEKALLKLAKDCEEGKAISSFWQEGGQLVCVVRYMNGREVKLTGADCKNFADLRRSRSYPSRGAL